MKLPSRKISKKSTVELKHDHDEDDIVPGMHSQDVHQTQVCQVNMRSLAINGVINEYTSESLIKALMILEAESPKEAITLFVNSPGGSVYDAFAIYDIMKNCKCPLITVGYGRVMSAGVLVISAGTKGLRFAYPNTYFMTHDMQVMTMGSFRDVDTQHKHFDELKKKYLDLTLSSSRVSKKKVIEMLSKEVYFGAEEAKELGIIDKIEVKRPLITFTR